MTWDECRAALAAAETTPVEALHTAVGLAADLVPEVTALLARAAADEPLLLAEERLVRYGLAALAAARRTEVFPALVALVAQSQLTRSRILGGDRIEAVPRLITALFDGDAAPLFAALRKPDVSAEMRQALFLALGWLVRGGLADRGALCAELDAFAADAPPADSPAWIGWLAAAAGLGLDERVAETRQRLIAELEEADPDDGLTLEEDEDLRDEIEAAGDPEALEVAAPVDDPAAVYPPLDDAPVPRGPADLSDAELSWLDWQLLVLGFQARALPLEAVDGYFTALHIAPGGDDLAAFEPPVWAGATAAERFSRPEVAAAARALLARHFASIGLRLAESDPPEPFYEMEDETTDGVLWVRGFATALEHQAAVWDPLLRREPVADLVAFLTMLENDPAAIDEDDALSPEARLEVLDRLPAAILHLRHLARERPARPAVRTGRNDPCPCGSGKKFKKCCGAPGAVPKF